LKSISRTTLVVFLISSGAVFGFLMLIRPRPLQDVAGLQDEAVLSVGKPRSGASWKHIVIHQTRTPGGTGEDYESFYRNVMLRPLGMGWHFLIQREPTEGRGLIYSSQRWREQADGRHTFNNYDADSIGIALVGRTTDPTTEDQLTSLVRLVKRLMSRYDIPPERVLLYREIDPRLGSPGPAFPVERFRRALTSDRP